MRNDVFGKWLVIDQENGAGTGFVLGHCNHQCAGIPVNCKILRFNFTPGIAWTRASGAQNAQISL
jgi:hypothetical protein